MKATLKITDHSEKFYAIEGSDYVFPKSLAESVTVEQEQKWEPKVGDWAYIRHSEVLYAHNHSNLSAGESFKVEEVSFQGKYIFLRPIAGETTGVDARLCRPALTHEIPAEARHVTIGDLKKESDKLYPLFNHMMEEHDLTLIDSEMHEIIRVVNQIQSVENEDSNPEARPDFKGWCVERNEYNAEVLNKWANSRSKHKGHVYSCKAFFYSEVVDPVFGDSPYLGVYTNKIIPGFILLPTVESFFEKVGYKPEPVRKSLGFYDGVEVFEGDKCWFVKLENLTIEEDKCTTVSDLEQFKDHFYTKSYLTPSAADARLREEVDKKARLVKFSIEEYEEWRINKTTCGSADPKDYARHLVEKEYNVKYLTEK